MMKNNKPLSFLICAMCLLSSCADYWEHDFFVVEQEEYVVDNVGETLTIPFKCNTDWYVWNSPYWMVFDQTSGSGDGELQIEVQRNNSSSRIGEANIIAGSMVRTISVSQKTSTSGVLKVVTGSGYTTSQKLYASINITSAHLASEAGVIIGNKTYRLTTISEGENTIEISASNLGIRGYYQAYAKNRYTGEYVYGENEMYKFL